MDQREPLEEEEKSIRGKESCQERRSEMKIASETKYGRGYIRKNVVGELKGTHGIIQILKYSLMEMFGFLPKAKGTAYFRC